jgi:hypothetical protein
VPIGPRRRRQRAEGLDEIISQHAPSVRSRSDWDDLAFQPFAALQLFRLDATTKKLTPSSTPAELKERLYKLSSTTVGASGPMKFVKGKFTYVNCWCSSQIKTARRCHPGRRSARRRRRTPSTPR